MAATVKSGAGTAKIAPVNFTNIPAELKAAVSFCVWKKERGKGATTRLTKIPYNPVTGEMAKTNDASTFGSFASAMKTYAMGGYDGIGIRVSEGIGAIDIDHCIREDGSLNDVAASILGIFKDAYFEKSPSGTGLRGFFSWRKASLMTRLSTISITGPWAWRFICREPQTDSLP